MKRLSAQMVARMRTQLEADYAAGRRIHKGSGVRLHGEETVGQVVAIENRNVVKVRWPQHGTRRHNRNFLIRVDRRNGKDLS